MSTTYTITAEKLMEMTGRAVGALPDDLKPAARKQREIAISDFAARLFTYIETGKVTS
jgi:hypothetical protein